MKTSPHKEWIKILLRESEVLNRYFNMDMNTLINISNEDILKKLKSLKGNNINYNIIGEGIKSLNIFKSLFDAKEIYVRCSAIKEFISNGTTPNITMLKLPFSDMVITLEDSYGDKYLPMFFSVFEKTEKYIYKGEKYPIICVKIAYVGYKDDKSVPKSEIEFHLTDPMLPRIFINCPKINQCNKKILNNIFKKSDGAHLAPKDLDVTDPMCQKTLRTSDLCIKKNEDETFATHCFDVLIFIINVIERLSRIPEKIIKEVKQHKSSNLNEKIYEDKEPVIYIKEKTYQYINGNQEKRKLKYNRESPCEHLRRGHWRYYKNGKKVWVEEITVSKDNKKTAKYILK